MRNFLPGIYAKKCICWVALLPLALVLCPSSLGCRRLVALVWWLFQLHRRLCCCRQADLHYA